MTTPLPPRWAYNTNYSSGPDVGNVTKTDPASQANGFIRGVNAAAQHVNFVVNPIADASRRAFLLAACRLRRVALEGTVPSDVSEGIAAIQRDIGTPLVLIKADNSYSTGDWDRFKLDGAVASLTSLVTDAAVDDTGFIVAIGTGGNLAAYSTDDGVTWTASAASMGVAGAGARIVWADGGDNFWVGRPGSATIKVGTQGGIAAGAWTTAGGAFFGVITGVAGLAIRSTNHLPIFLDTVLPPQFFTVSHGASPLASTIPNAASATDSGSLCGNDGPFVYHVARLNSGATLQVSSSPGGDADIWTALASIPQVGGSSFNSRPRIMMCQTTGLLVIVAPTSSNQDALYASIDGADWVGPLLVFPGPGVDAYSLAGGRLVATRDDMLFASDGVGF